MKEITSTKNNQLKEWKKLHKKKYREELNQYIIEGFHLVEEAVKANADVQWILFNQRGQQEWGTWLAEQETEKLIFVSDEVLNSLSELPTSQGILAIVTLETQQEQSLSFKGGWLLLDNIQDPGNVGTMIRTADAAGLAGVIAYYEQEAVENYALILGNEGSGVSPELLAETTKNLYIPMKGQAESLNVAIAAGVLMFYFENNQ